MILIWEEKIEGILLGDPWAMTYQYEVYLQDYDMGLKTWIDEPGYPVRATLMTNGQSYFLSIVNADDRVMAQSWRKM